MTISFEQLVETLKSGVDWDKWFRMVNRMSGEMNAETERFNKSRVLEKGLVFCSAGLFTYIDKKGRDLAFNPEEGVYVEVKGKKGNWFDSTRSRGGRFRLVNGNSNDAGLYIELPGDYAQYIMFYSEHAVAIGISRELTNFMEHKGTNIDIVVPSHALTLIARKNTELFEEDQINIPSLSEMLEEAINKWYEKF